MLKCITCVAPPAFLTNAVLLQLHHADWPIIEGRVGLHLLKLCLSSSNHTLCIDSAIDLAGVAADSNPLQSRRTPTGEAEEQSSPFTHGGVS